MVQFGPGAPGANSALNVTAATVLKASEGMLYKVSVTAAGTAAGGVYDASTLSGNVAANQIGVIGTAVTSEPLRFDWRCLAGILIVPPTGGTVSVLFV